MSSQSFWLGDRDNIPNDFDGVLRTCQIVRRLLVVDDDDKPYDDRYLLVIVDPAFPLKDGSIAPEIALLEPSGHSDLGGLDNEPGGQQPWWTVFIAHVVDRSRIDDGIVPLRGLIAQASGQIALRPDLLPTSQRESFERGLAFLRRFVEREGHAAVPSDYVENGFPLGLWVENIRLYTAEGLPSDQAQELNALPGWRWN
ncbi:MAG TPA: helicase associated domain-containing protein [Candidatus Dormibacteraeota bacterium]|nr:helicase associated domain-containing protein [Candidatus Dormibacteraeota bacterium]